MAMITSYVSSKAAENGFYPTPPELIEKMMARIDWNMVDSVLEPSAGKGDLALAAAQRLMRSYNWTPDRLHALDLDCVEIDPNLRAILKDKGLRVVHDNFLTFQTAKQYSLILMNPPFEDGDSHLLKAISLLRDGGQLVCLLNAETIRNPYSAERKRLRNVLDAMDAEITYVQDAFLSAERKTDVELAMIKMKKPVVTRTDSLIMDKLKGGHKYVEMSEEAQQSLTKADFVEAIVDRYNYEIDCGCMLIREWGVMRELLKTSLTPDHAYSFGLDISVGKESPTINAFVRATRKKYWSALFCAPQFMAQLTSNLKDDLMKRVDDLQNYEFSVYNIYEIMIQMTARINKGVEDAIMGLFDDWTRKYHWDENSQNRHYFDGWKTNDAFAVNKKVIIPLYAWDSIFGHFELGWRPAEKITDIERIMNYLDGGRTAEGRSVREIFVEAQKEGKTRKIETKYFWITFFKKGTCHIEFKDMELLAKFNIFAARGKNWLPPSFGRKRYAEMDSEERKTVDSFFAGDRKAYDAVVEHPDYYLSNGSSLMGLTA